MEKTDLQQRRQIFSVEAVLHNVHVIQTPELRHVDAKLFKKGPVDTCRCRTCYYIYLY